MIYIYVDTDKRKYLQAIVSAKKQGVDFKLMPKNATPDTKAAGVFSADKDVLKQWTDAGVEEYKIDKSVPAPAESVAENTAKTKK